MLNRQGLSEGLDTQVQGTNDDAQISKLSCSRAGYFQDAFVQHFVRKPVRRSPLINRGYFSRYAALRQLLHQFLDLTASTGQRAQVLVLGAGFDTAWFQLAEAGKQPARYLELDFKQVTQRKVAIVHQQPTLWDLVTAVHAQYAQHGQQSQLGKLQLQQQQQQQEQAMPHQQKPYQLRNCSVQQQTSHSPSRFSVPAAPASNAHPPARSPATATIPVTPAPTTTPASTTPVTSTPVAPAPETVQSPRLTLPRLAPHAPPPHPPAPVPAGVHFSREAGELCSDAYCVLPVDLRDSNALTRAVQRAGLDFTAPTYILSECVLVYMEPEASNQLLKWLSAHFTNAVVAIYEQIKPDDAFGRQMMSNLEARGCPLRGLPATPTLKDHCQRLRACGWPTARAWDMDAIYKWHLDPCDRARVEALEVFDEFEEWHLIQEHYSISVGIQGGLGERLGFGPQGMVTA